MIVAVCPTPEPDLLLKIGPEPGNATLTSNTASADPLVNAYVFTSPNPYALTALIVPYVEPEALFFFNASPDTNVPLVLYKNVVVLDTPATRYPVAPLVAPTT